VILLRIWRGKKRKIDPYKTYIDALESLRKEIKNLLTKNDETMIIPKKNLKSIIDNDLEQISTDFNDTKSVVDDIKESDLIKKISNKVILDAKDFIPI